MLTSEVTGANDTYTSLSENIWGPKRSSLYIVLPITVTYVIIFILGFFGNVVTCIVVIRNKYMHTVTNYYLLSLAVSDLLLLITGLPSEMYQIWYRYPYIFGEMFCILQGLTAETSANATVLTITAFTIERYVAICYPFFSHAATKLKRAIRYILLIWLLSFFFAIIQAMQLGLVYGRDEHEVIIEELSVCGLKNDFIPHSFEISMFLFFVAPMSVITVLYILIGMKLYKPSIASSGKRKPVLISTSNRDVNHQHIVHPDPSSYVTHSKSTKRVVKMLVAVVVAFFICWAPFQTQRLLAVYGYTGSTTSNTMYIIYEIVTYISGILYYFSAVINPILYNIMSNKFRRAFHDTITSCFQSTSVNRRNSGEIGSSGAQRLNFETTKHNNSLCSKNSCSTNNVMGMVADFNQRPIVISFRKSAHLNMNSALQKPETITFSKSLNKVNELSVLNKNMHCGSSPGILVTNKRSNDIILYPSCKCSSIRKHCAVYQTDSKFYSE